MIVILRGPLAQRIADNVTTWYHTTSSVTRFGQFSPLWQYFESLGRFCKGLISVWPNYEPTLAIPCDIGLIFTVVNGQILNI